MIGVGLVSFVLIVAASLRGSVDKVLSDRFVAQFQASTTDFSPLPVGTVDALRAVDGVDTVAA